MKFKILLLLLVFSLSSFSHKFYVSVTEVEYNKETKSLQIISRIFIDDLEKLLQERYDRSVKLSMNKDEGAVKPLISKYLNQKFSVEVDGKNYPFKYLGKEYEKDMAVLYIEVPNVPEFTSVKIKNAILTDLFGDQKNLVHVEYKGETKSLILTGERDKEILIFD